MKEPPHRSTLMDVPHIVGGLPRRDVARSLTALGYLGWAQDEQGQAYWQRVLFSPPGAADSQQLVTGSQAAFLSHARRFDDVLRMALHQGPHVSAFLFDTLLAHCIVRVTSEGSLPLSMQETSDIVEVLNGLPARFWRLLTRDELLDVPHVLSLLRVKPSTSFFFWWGVRMRGMVDTLTHAQLSELMEYTLVLGVSKELGARFFSLWNARWRRTLGTTSPSGVYAERIKEFGADSLAELLNFAVANAVHFDSSDVEAFFSRFRSRLFAVSASETELFLAICSSVESKVKCLDASALAAIPGAFVAFNVSPSDAFFREWCSACGSTLSSFDTAALFSLTRVGFELKLVRHPASNAQLRDLLLLWAREIETSRLRSLSPAQLCDILRVAYTLRVDFGDAFYLAWAKECSHRLKLDQFLETDLALCIHWVGMLKLDSSIVGFEFFRRWMDRASVCMDSFNSTSLVNIICAAGRSQFLLRTDAPFLFAWIRATTPRISDLQFADLANTIFALGQLHVRDRLLSIGSDFLETDLDVKDFVERMEERCERLMTTLPSLQTSHLVMVLSGIEMLGRAHNHSSRLMISWLSKFQQNLPQLNALELSQSILSLGRLQISPDMFSPSVLPSLEELLVKLLAHMELEQLDDVFEGFELLNWPVDLDVSTQCAAHVNSKMLSVDPKTLSGALRLVRRLKLDSDTVPVSFFLDFAQACKQNLRLFAPVDVPWIMTSLAHLKIDPAIMGRDFFVQWAALCDGLWPHYSPLHYASIVYDLGYMKLPVDWLVPEFFRHWAHQVRNICFLFSPVDVSNTLYGIRLLGLQHDQVGSEFVASFQSSIKRVVAELEPLHLARLVTALPMVDFPWSSDVLSRVGQACVERALSCSPIQLCHTLLGLAMLDSRVPLEGKAHLDLCEIAVNRLTETGWQGLDGVWVKNAWYALMWFGRSDIPTLQQLVPGESASNSNDAPSSSSSSSELSERNDFIRHHYLPDVQMFVDVYIPSSDTIVFLDTETRYVQRLGSALDPFEVFVGELLKRRGYGVMRIDVRGHS
jgi:hypothetical protein